MIATIPKERIQKISLYVNKDRLTMEQVKAKLGCQYILNAGLFDMATFKAINHLTVDGEVLSQSGNPFGYAIRDDKMVFSYGNNVKYPSFIGAYPVMVRFGGGLDSDVPAGLGGSRERSAVGLKGDGSLVLYCTRSGRTLRELETELVAAGCDTAINLDGGGSSQCDFNGERLTGGRIVHNYLCVWTDEPEKEPEGRAKSMKILLISGHGGGDPGATATINGKAYREADETRSVTAALASALKGAAEVTVYPTDRNAYQDYKYGTLAAVAQFKNYDYVLEIHFNAFKQDPGDGKTKGTEIYVTTTEAGTTVEQAIVKSIAAVGLTNRGVKRNNFAVIHQAKQAGTSSALLEVCFLDDADDMKVYAAKQSAIVQAIAKGIMDGFGLKVETDREVVQAKAGLSDSTMDYLQAYKYGDDLLRKLASAMK